MPRGKLDYLPKRPCDNCGTRYQPHQPLRPGNCGFCCGNCRKEYHKHGGSFSKLKPIMNKKIIEEVKARVKALNPHDAEAWARLQARVEKLEVAMRRMQEACQI